MTETSAQKSTSERSNKLTSSASSEGRNDPQEDLVFTVVSAVAEASGTDVLELPPLNDVIDPEALAGLFTARPESGVEEVTFQYAGYTVVVRGSDDVRVALASEA